MFSFLMFILWIASMIALYIEFNTVWLIVFIATLVYLVIRGAVAVGIDIGDIFD